MTKRIAIIPARGGSKRIPNKNIKKFCGKPIIAYTLEAAKASGLFDLIHVSTDSQGIISVVESLGFSVDFKRPRNLADDETPIMPVLKYVLERYIQKGMEFSQVWLLMPCTPLIEAGDLKKAEKLFQRHENQKTVLAVAPFPVPLEWAFDRASNGELNPMASGNFAIPSQDLEVKYYDAGAFAVFSEDCILRSKGAGTDNDFVGYILRKDQAIDIDDLEDWRLAEILFLGRKAKIEKMIVDRS